MEDILLTMIFTIPVLVTAAAQGCVFFWYLLFPVPHDPLAHHGHIVRRPIQHGPVPILLQEVQQENPISPDISGMADPTRFIPPRPLIIRLRYH